MFHSIYPRDRSSGFTLIELLVAISIICLLLALILPAIQRVREAANKTLCGNRHREIGIALQHYHVDQKFFPSNGGWDGVQKIQATDGSMTNVTTFDYQSGILFTWGVGNPSLPPKEQTGSWAFSILPYCEQDSIYQKLMIETAFALYSCPSRRLPQPAAPVNDQYGFYNGGGWKWGKTDYAGNGYLIENRPRCATIESIRDGTSHTVLVGEKSLPIQLYESDSWYWDEPYFVGGSGGTKRLGSLIARDTSRSSGYWFIDNWGSMHISTVPFLFCDGSVRFVGYSIEPSVLRALLTPRSGEIVPELD